MSDMIFEIEATPPRKVPTLWQFLCQEVSVKLKQKYLVTKIWFPNKFPALCFETEDFRVNIDESHPLFDSLDTFAKSMIESSTPFAIIVNPDRDGGFGITSMGEKGEWEKLGRSGFEFKVAVKKTPKMRT